MLKKNYGILITPISILAHLIMLNVIYYFCFLPNSFFEKQLIYINVFWLCISYFTNIYSFKRHTKAPKILIQLFYQFSIFTFAYLAYFSIFKEFLHLQIQLKFICLIILGITIFRILYFYSIRRYRFSGHNYRNVVIIGSNQGVHSLIEFFKERLEFGFKYQGYFTDKTTKNKNYLGKIEDSFNYIKKNDIDEVYCSIASLTKTQISQFIKFGDDYLKIIKFIPDSKELISKMKLEYYGYVPVLSIRQLPFDKVIIKRLKRFFDILFSLTVIIGVLSWLTPILYIAIKLESSGNLFFTQTREGLKGKPFKCFKFRSMAINNQSDNIQTTKNDARITKVGAFIRKTSIDELPQFYNVLIGEMSVVGPRPHMLSQSELFKKIVDKYMVRHFVKPGVTGLAQVKGYRGEIEKDSDIINRVKYDIFYIENWSFFLDTKIVLQTLFNAIKGEEKAY